jgi:hypothetical protein
VCPIDRRATASSPGPLCLKSMLMAITARMPRIERKRNPGLALGVANTRLPVSLMIDARG